MGMTAQGTTGGEWEWPPVSKSLDTYGIFTIKCYIQIRQDTVAVHVGFRIIYELCTGAERIPGKRNCMLWWKQEVGKEVE